MSEIVLTRIDDRLVHGQVMTSWLNYTSANKIMIVDDGVAKDMFMKSVLATVLPANISLEIYNIADASERIKKGFSPKDKVIILAKLPATIWRMMENGVTLDKVNVGGMGVSGTRKKFYKNIAVSEEEKEIFKKIIATGCTVTIQIIAEDKATDISKLL
ncbi:MAG: PTS mannose/fructose/sorbose transporter subunit IIB [Ruminococcaceae bacterium]|jgi:PTS system mannose-specific IIB component|nr:PTS mannose/fructose/sorbose transporter subunit IIB [Oscillospiraceae bacterium]